MHDKIVTSIITKLPVSLVELSQVSDRSVVSSMTDNTTATNISDETGRNTVSTGEESQLSVATTGKTKTLWNGTEILTVDQVYLKNIVEIPTKDEMRTLNNIIKKVVFPKMKFIPNWEDCLVLTHDKEKDINEKHAGWAHSIFRKMNWESDDHFPAYMQAIKWNTYKHSFKQHFNNTRANIITNLKRHMVSGKSNCDSRLQCFIYLTNILVSIL